MGAQLRDSDRRLAALKNRPKSGRPSGSPQQWRELLKILKKGAIRAGFETDAGPCPGSAT